MNKKMKRVAKNRLLSRLLEASDFVARLNRIKVWGFHGIMQNNAGPRPGSSKKGIFCVNIPQNGTRSAEKSTFFIKFGGATSGHLTVKGQNL